VACPVRAELVVDYGTNTADRPQRRHIQAGGDSISSRLHGLKSSSAPSRRSRLASRISPTQTILGWADKIRKLMIWTNADKPKRPRRPAPTAPRHRLCRTEHMFREGDRLETRAQRESSWLPSPRGPRTSLRARSRLSLPKSMPIWPSVKTAMGQKLEKLQQGDLEGILAAIPGLPVVIRLIDPPLHEFLPNLEDQLVKVTKAGDAATAEDKQVLATISRCTNRTDARPSRLPPRPDDPGLRQDSRPAPSSTRPSP